MCTFPSSLAANHLRELLCQEVYYDCGAIGKSLTYIPERYWLKTRMIKSEGMIR